MIPRLLKKVIPNHITQYYRKLRYGKRQQSSNHDSIEKIFTDIYKKNKWGDEESVSGAGATRAQTMELVVQINQLLIDLKIQKLLDIPCGDFNWMQHVNLTGIAYHGADIVKEIVDSNDAKHRKKEGFHFFQCDLTSDTLPECDLIINRDCLVHLSYLDIWKALENMKRSGSRYLLTTTFTDHPLNFDISTGSWRTLNLEKKPFHFPKPIVLLNERCTEHDGMFRDKCLGLWSLTEIRV